MTQALVRLAGAFGLALLLLLILVGVASSTPRPSAAARSSVLVTPVWLGNPIASETYSVPYSARHIWDLQVWRGRIYLGYGDWIGNSGPLDIWYYTPTAGCFVSETVYVSATLPAAQLDEEAIHRYVVIDGDLYIPGTDPITPESWDWGNFYRNDGSGWVKYRTIPYGIHAFDMVSHSGELFVAIGANNAEPLLRSTNEGLTWTAAISEVSMMRFYNFYKLDDALFAVRRPIDTYPRPMVYRYQSSRFVSTAIQLVPDRPDTPIVVYDDMVSFGGAVLYVPWYWDMHIQYTWPLTALYAIRAGHTGQPVSFFDGKHPRDLAASEGQVYVLDAGGPRDVWYAGSPDQDGYTTTIYVSSDLTAWFPVATAHFTDTPSALEVLDGVAYVGTYSGDIYALPLSHYRFYFPLVFRE
jgi:hypothetical protein